MTSETLARTGTRDRLVVQEARGRSEGRGLAGRGRSLVSMVLTSRAHRRRTPKKNRSIPTIPAGNIDAGSVDVSAVDTRPRRSESEVLAAQPGAPSRVHPHCPLPVACAGSRWSWFDSGPAPSRPESVCSTRVGIYWPRVVRTARRPHLPEVHPTLLQWRPTLVQCVQTMPEATTVTGSVCSGRPRQQLSHLADPPRRCLEMS